MPGFPFAARRQALRSKHRRVSLPRNFQHCHVEMISALQENAGHLRAAYAGHANKAQNLAPGVQKVSAPGFVNYDFAAIAAIKVWNRLITAERCPLSAV